MTWPRRMDDAVVQAVAGMQRRGLPIVAAVGRDVALGTTGTLSGPLIRKHRLGA